MLQHTRRTSPYCSALQVQAQIANPLHNRFIDSALSLEGMMIDVELQTRFD
jgi:hypothetical protein